jgi:hypothetical protein
MKVFASYGKWRRSLHFVRDDIGGVGRRCGMEDPTGRSYCWSILGSSGKIDEWGDDVRNHSEQWCGGAFLSGILNIPHLGKISVSAIIMTIDFAAILGGILTW